LYYCRIGTITSIASKPSSSSSPVYQLYPPSSHGAVPSSADRPPSPLLSQLSASNPNSFPPPSSEKLLLLRHRRERVEEVDSLTMYKYYKQQLSCVSLYFLPALYTRWENLRGVGTAFLQQMGKPQECQSNLKHVTTSLFLSKHFSVSSSPFSNDFLAHSRNPSPIPSSPSPIFPDARFLFSHAPQLARLLRLGRPHGRRRRQSLDDDDARERVQPCSHLSAGPDGRRDQVR